MTTLGALGTARTLECDDLIVKNTQNEVKTNKILFKNGSDTLWSLGYDDETNFVLTNELHNPPIVSISASIDNGNVFIKGGGGGGGGGGATTLTALTDVNTTGVQNGGILYYDSLTAKYEFSNNLININEVRGLNPIKLESNYTTSSAYIEFDRDFITAKNALNNVTPLHIDSDITLGNNSSKIVGLKTIEANDIIKFKGNCVPSSSNYIGFSENQLGGYTALGGQAELLFTSSLNLDYQDIINVSTLSTSNIVALQSFTAFITESNQVDASNITSVGISCDELSCNTLNYTTLNPPIDGSQNGLKMVQVYILQAMLESMYLIQVRILSLAER